ncbi:MAG TPA: hypothetical protein VHD35_00940, partial [Chitinophagaceae bacterium]|nr:hypothetical protein [Chitinophagaceae bacterium]
MNDIKQEYSPYVQNAIKQIDEHIAHYKEMIATLELHKKMWQEHKPEPRKLPLTDAPLTRETIRNFFSMYSQPTQTVPVINMLYPNKSENEKEKLIKTLSVIFNQMAKEGEIIIEKKK